VGKGFYNDFHVLVRRPHQGNHLRIRRQNLTRTLRLLRDIIRAQHKHDHIGLCTCQPALQIIRCDIHSQVPRMAFMVFVPVGVFGGRAVLRVGGTGTDELDARGEVGGDEGVPDEGPPAGYFRDGVAEGHWVC
jgi:hypothetical protein